MSMREVVSIILLCLVASTTLCSCNQQNKELENIEILLNAQQLVPARQEMSKVNVSNLSEKDRAFYSLLKVKLDYISYEPIVSDTLINYSLKYYSKNGPAEKLTEALYYKAAIKYDEGNIQEAFTNIKKAEYNLKKVTSIDIKHKIYEKLTDWNMSSGEYEIALKYAKVNLKYSSMVNNANWMAYSCVFLAQIYDNLGKKDSSDYYLGKSTYFIQHITKKEKIAFLNYLAYRYMTSDIAKAKKYLQQSIVLGKDYSTYAIAGQIYAHEGSFKEAEDALRKALSLTKDYYDKEYVLTELSDFYAGSDQYEKAYTTAFDLISVKDSISAESKQNDISGLQKRYDIEMKEKHFKDIIIYIIFIAAVLLLVNIIVYIYLKNKFNKASKESLENQLLINIYNNKINELKSSNDDKDNKVEILNSKISELHDKQAKILYEGRSLYEKILNGETVITWSKSDFVHFIEYYKLIDLPFVNSLEHNYDAISPRYQFFEILYHMGKDDKEVERILGISHNTVRSTRTRIKAKKLVED